MPGYEEFSPELVVAGWRSAVTSQIQIKYIVSVHSMDRTNHVCRHRSGFTIDHIFLLVHLNYVDENFIAGVPSLSVRLPDG